MSPTATKTPALGDPVFFEGLPHKITLIVGGLVEFSSEKLHEGTTLTRGNVRVPQTQPLFRTSANLADLRWSTELNAWYLWGRLLSKGRGGVGTDERLIVAELRDRGLLPARETRPQGSGPAGGEHHNLHAALFRANINWAQELANVRRGDGLSANAQAAVTAYGARFKKKLTEGFADPDANDSTGEA